MTQYEKIPTINIYFSLDKIDTTPVNLGIPSLHFDQLKQVTQIFFKVGEGEDIAIYCELTPETISQEMDHIFIYPVVTETDKRTRYKLKDHTEWEEFKES